MNRIFKTVVLSAAVAATTLAALPLAQAGERWGHGPRRPHVTRHHGHGDLALAGILGLAAGALVVGLASQQPAYELPPDALDYRREPMDRGNYRVVRRVQPTYASGGLQPWSAAWYAYCDDRYRTFDDRTGTYAGADGRQHFCIAD